jgi:hypothetical protein
MVPETSLCRLRFFRSQKETIMRKGVLTALALAALSASAVAQQQGGISEQSLTGRQTEPQSGALLGSSQALAGHQISPQQLSAGQVREIQQALHDRGQRSIHVTGEWGPDTEAALKNFQQSEDVTPQAGELDAPTIVALGLDPSSYGLLGVSETTGQAPGGTSEQHRTQEAPQQPGPQNGGRQMR